ncbi:uncharacterized protein V6R79_018934 [Siganus canaliculatus]
MTHIIFVCFCFIAGLGGTSSLRTLDKRLDCNQQGLDNCKISNCSGNHTFVQRWFSPTEPEWASEKVGVWADKHGLVSVLNVTWQIKADASIFKLQGSEITIVDESTNQSMCVQFSYKFNQQQNPKHRKWEFSLNGVVVEPGHTYSLSMLNLPLPDTGEYKIQKQIPIPECGNPTIDKTLTCLQNGSLWDPQINTHVHKEQESLVIVVNFQAAQYSERYLVSFQSHGFHYSTSVFKENRTLLNVTMKVNLWQLSQCEMVLLIQPFFIRCQNNCSQHTKIIRYCQYQLSLKLIIKASVGVLFVGIVLACLLWRTRHKDRLSTSSFAAREPSEDFQVRARKRVLIIYSLDHPLYKDIVLKLCAFLATKCGTEVVLDLFDSARLGVLGSIQWLDWHRARIEDSSDKILILCSRGVQAKWRAMCGGTQVPLREDSLSTVGDMLSPALSLMVPHFVRSASFERYMVAYFDDVCSEEDVPSPFNITVRYKLMKQFEELFFRILDTEKHKPGHVNRIEGLSENEYYKCAPGRALRDAIEAFHSYQLQNPQWFEDQLLESSELVVEKTSAKVCVNNETTTTNLIIPHVPDSTQVFILSHITANVESMQQA